MSKKLSRTYGSTVMTMSSMLVMLDAAAATAPVSSTFGTPLLSLGLGGLLTSMGLSPDAAGLVASGLMVAIIAGVGLFVYRMVKNKDTPANPSLPSNKTQPLPPKQPAAVPKAAAPKAAVNTVPKAAPKPAPKPAPAPAAPPPPKWGGPTDFDMDTFLRQSKASFVRMQAAWDKADTTDLQKFTTPQVFAELSVQVQAKGPSPDQTEVVSISAEMLGIETMGDHYLASVKFNGMIKSTPNAMAEPFAEVWNLAKPLDGSSGWLLAGIQQLS